MPSIGKPLTFDLYGPPAEPWILAFSLDRYSLDLPPFGELKLHPSTLAVLAAGTLDATGHAQFELAIADNATLLAGNGLHWQAVLGLDLQLSNRQHTPWSDL